MRRSLAHPGTSFPSLTSKLVTTDSRHDRFTNLPLSPETQRPPGTQQAAGSTPPLHPRSAHLCSRRRLHPTLTSCSSAMRSASIAATSGQASRMGPSVTAALGASIPMRRKLLSQIASKHCARCLTTGRWSYAEDHRGCGHRSTVISASNTGFEWMTEAVTFVIEMHQ